MLSFWEGCVWNSNRFETITRKGESEQYGSLSFQYNWLLIVILILQIKKLQSYCTIQNGISKRKNVLEDLIGLKDFIFSLKGEGRKGGGQLSTVVYKIKTKNKKIVKGKTNSILVNNIFIFYERTKGENIFSPLMLEHAGCFISKTKCHLHIYRCKYICIYYDFYFIFIFFLGLTVALAGRSAVRSFKWASFSSTRTSLRKVSQGNTRLLRQIPNVQEGSRKERGRGNKRKDRECIPFGWMRKHGRDYERKVRFLKRCFFLGDPDQ